MRQSWLPGPLWLSLLPAVLVALNWKTVFTTLYGLVQNDTTRLVSGCASQSYTTHIFSKDPLVIYVASFLSASEAKELAHTKYEMQCMT